MNYPQSRLRRLRYNKIVREICEDINILPKDLIYPIFVCEGENIKNEIKSLVGQHQISIDNPPVNIGKYFWDGTGTTNKAEVKQDLAEVKQNH